MMAVLDLEAGFTLEELKRRYKTLAKRHHPDLHNGCRIAEERLKQINEAYTFLVANQLHR
jgi:DnaJ-class molecular chaperone